MADQRTAHPYHMYDAILAQPALVARVLEAERELISRAAEAAAGKKRLIFAGIGTSLHAAAVGEHFLRHLSRGRLHAQVEQSFELVHYPTALSADDALIVVSHRGWKNFSVEAVRRAKTAGALTIAVTGLEGGDGIRAADFAIPTCEQEISFAHTKSYTTAMAALALLAIGIAEKRGQLAAVNSPRADLSRVSAWMKESLAVEAAARAAARELAARPRLFFVGAGPNWSTATDGALKVKETSYSAAEGVETEQLLHGPLAEIGPHCAVVMHFAGGPSDARAAEAWAALGELGALRIAVVSKGAVASIPNLSAAAAASISGGHRLEVPAVPEWLSPLVHVVPIQLLSYFLALERGTNPDTGHEDEASHARAVKYFQL
jgi:glucosamine--fructose-6-phosphate aminotransferase (isomerizing)